MRLIVAFHNVANVTKNSMEIKLRNCDLCHWTSLSIWHTFLQVCPIHWYKPTKLCGITFQRQCSLQLPLLELTSCKIVDSSM
jgi:hypothetical protein